MDSFKLKVYQPCVQSCAWNQRRKKRTFTTFTNLGYKSFGKKFLRKNFHEKANNLFGKHSVEKFPWKKKKNLFDYKHSIEKIKKTIKKKFKNFFWKNKFFFFIIFFFFLIETPHRGIMTLVLCTQFLATCEVTWPLEKK